MKNTNFGIETLFKIIPDISFNKFFMIWFDDNCSWSKSVTQTNCTMHFCDVLVLS